MKFNVFTYSTTQLSSRFCDLDGDTMADTTMDHAEEHKVEDEELLRASITTKKFDYDSVLPLRRSDEMKAILEMMNQYQLFIEEQYSVILQVNEENKKQSLNTNPFPSYAISDMKQLFESANNSMCDTIMHFEMFSGKMTSFLSLTDTFRIKKIKIEHHKKIQEEREKIAKEKKREKERERREKHAAWVKEHGSYDPIECEEIPSEEKCKCHNPKRTRCVVSRENLYEYIKIQLDDKKLIVQNDGSMCIPCFSGCCDGKSPEARERAKKLGKKPQPYYLTLVRFNEHISQWDGTEIPRYSGKGVELRHFQEKSHADMLSDIMTRLKPLVFAARRQIMLKSGHIACPLCEPTDNYRSSLGVPITDEQFRTTLSLQHATREKIYKCSDPRCIQFFCVECCASFTDDKSNTVTHADLSCEMYRNITGAKYVVSQKKTQRDELKKKIVELESKITRAHVEEPVGAGAGAGAGCKTTPENATDTEQLRTMKTELETLEKEIATTSNEMKAQLFVASQAGIRCTCGEFLTRHDGCNTILHEGTQSNPCGKTMCYKCGKDISYSPTGARWDPHDHIRLSHCAANEGTDYFAPVGHMDDMWINDD